MSDFYAVRVGKEPGIYETWEKTEEQVKGYPKAEHKKFKTKKEAKEYMKGLDSRPASKVSPENNNPGRNPDNLENSLIVYTDGAAIGNPGPGGYGIVTNTGKKFSGGFRLTTNNRMELMAVIMALKKFKNSKKLIIHSDSAYVINSITKGWAKKWKNNDWVKPDGKPALNPDLWKKFLFLEKKINVEFRKVKGHSGNPLNEKADELANSAARKTGLPDDQGYLDSI